MAITSVPGMWVPSPWPMETGAPALSFRRLNASGDVYAAVIQVPRTGTLHSFETRIGTVTNNPDNGIRFSFQDVSLTTGDPDGGVDQFCVIPSITANTWTAPPNALTSDGTAGGVKRTVTRGDLIACCVDFASFVASDSFDVSINFTGEITAANWYNTYFSAAAWGKTTDDGALIALRYDDGYAEMALPLWPVLTQTTRSFHSGSTPDERGLVFQLLSDQSVGGLWARIALNGTADLVLYDSSSSVLGTVPLDNNQKANINGIPYWGYLPTSVTLTAATTYRMAVKPTSVTSIDVYDMTLNSAGLMACLPGGVQWYGSTRTDGGAWTDSTTIRPHMGLFLDGFGSNGAETPTVTLGAAQMMG